MRDLWTIQGACCWSLVSNFRMRVRHIMIDIPTNRRTRQCSWSLSYGVHCSNGRLSCHLGNRCDLLFLRSKKCFFLCSLLCLIISFHCLFKLNFEARRQKLIEVSNLVSVSIYKSKMASFGGIYNFSLIVSSLIIALKPSGNVASSN